MRNLPRAELKPPSSELARQILNHWTARKVLPSASSQTWNCFHTSCFCCYCWVFFQSHVFKYYMLVTQACQTLCNPMNCSLPGSSVHGILQARILEWVVIPFFRGSSWPRNWSWVSHIAGRFFTIWATRKAPKILKIHAVVCLLKFENHVRWLTVKVDWHLGTSTVLPWSCMPLCTPGTQDPAGETWLYVEWTPWAPRCGQCKGASFSGKANVTVTWN